MPTTNLTYVHKEEVLDLGVGLASFSLDSKPHLNQKMTKDHNFPWKNSVNSVAYFSEIRWLTAANH